MGLMTGLRDAFRSWLNIEPAANDMVVSIQQPYNYQVSVYRNQIWYRGEPAELQQFYEQVGDYVSDTMFWQARSTTGINFRKIHTGLPAMIVDVLADIVMRDLIDIKVVNNTEAQERWNNIAEENEFNELLKDAITRVLVEGDGAFKLSFDKEISELPIIEFYSSTRVEYEERRGRLVAVVFTTPIPDQLTKNKYVYLKERYGKEDVTFWLENDAGKRIDDPTAHYPAFSQLEAVKNPNEFLLALPMLFGQSAIWPKRGKSLFETKHGAFDGYDEVFSTWMDALRDGRATKYIPQNMVPQSATDGHILTPNSFDNRYITTPGDRAEDGKNEIKVVQSDIHSNDLQVTYITALDLCLQGIISPSTLGIDVKKLDNAEAQREKEKATLYTRSKIIEVLNKTIPVLVQNVLMMDDMLKETTPGEYEVSISFGEYANPSFEATVETVGKARQQQIMSVERAVEEMYGDSLTAEEKALEVKRIQAEQGIIAVEENGAEADLNLDIPADPDALDETITAETDDTPEQEETDIDADV